MKIVAVITYRNEARYLATTLRHIVEQGLLLAMIDHGSTDESNDIVKKFRPYVVYEGNQPWTGCFSLFDQLRYKKQVYRGISADWFVHQDADEILHSLKEGESLYDGISRMDASGFNAINFDEFTFVPTLQHPDHDNKSFYETMLWYYFHTPIPVRLMRAWKNRVGVTQIDGGNRLSGDGLQMSAENFALRHYIFLSKAHAASKYPRAFDVGDIARGWHGSRVNFPDNLVLRNESELEALDSCYGRRLSRWRPRKRHFWEEGW